MKVWTSEKRLDIEWPFNVQVESVAQYVGGVAAEGSFHPPRRRCKEGIAVIGTCRRYGNVASQGSLRTEEGSQWCEVEGQAHFVSDARDRRRSSARVVAAISSQKRTLISPARQSTSFQPRCAEAGV